MLKLPNNKMSDDNPDKDIYSADNSIRQLAIKILDEISHLYGDEELFDSIKLDSEGMFSTVCWYDYEDLVTGLIVEAMK